MAADNDITNLLIITAAIPEIREELKELTRMLKGSNGKLGLVARLSEQERAMAYQRSQFEAFRNAHKEEHEKLHTLINDRLDELTKAIECVQDEICREERVIASESRKNKFTLKRDWRAFLYGLATAGGVLVLERLISTVFNLLN